MKLTLRNLGRLREATIDLDKNLILLTGPNNTSKTYVAHAIYGFHANLPRYATLAVDYAFEGYFSRTADMTEPVRIDVLEFIDQRLPRFLESLNQSFRKDLADILASTEEFVARTEVLFEIDDAVVAQSRQTLLELESKAVLQDGIIGNKTSGDPIWTFESIPVSEPDNVSAASASSRVHSLMRRRAWGEVAALFSVTLMGAPTRTHVLTAERAAIQLFSRELSLKRTELVDDLLRLESSLRGMAAGQAIEQTLGQRARRYPLAIRHNLRISNDLATYKKKESSFASIARQMERGLLRGTIHVDEEGDLSFQPEGSDANLGLHLASSSVKSLAGLSFFLRHIAEENQFLIIDEPELNLHPDNQRKVARVLARIARSGIKVMMSTHSDYIIRELNNLIMLSADKNGAVCRQHDYDEQETLSPSQVGAYLFNSERANPIEVKPTGIEVETIDREINSLNTVSQEIYFALFGETSE